MATVKLETQTLDLAVADRMVVFDVSKYTDATVLTLQRGNEPAPSTLMVALTNYFALSTPITLVAPGITAETDVSGFGYLAVKVTTPAGGAGTARIVLCAKSL